MLLNDAKSKELLWSSPIFQEYSWKSYFLTFQSLNCFFLLQILSKIFSLRTPEDLRKMAKNFSSCKLWRIWRILLNARARPIWRQIVRVSCVFVFWSGPWFGSSFPECSVYVFLVQIFVSKKKHVIGAGVRLYLRNPMISGILNNKIKTEWKGWVNINKKNKK